MMINSSALKKFSSALLLSISMLVPSLYAQQERPNVTNTAFLRSNGVRLSAQAASARIAAFTVAQQKGWALMRTDRDGSVMRLQRLDDAGLPVYYITTNNIIAAGTTRTDKLYSNGGLGLSLSGSKIPAGKVAIWDSDAALTSHVEFAGGRIEVRDNTTTTSVHSTHVAGTMIAAGVNSVARGMAFGLPKLYSFDFDNDTPEMSASAAELLISNHSYGSLAGWSLNTSVNPERWEFYAPAGANEDYKFGYYDSQSSEWDKICYNAPYYLPVKSAGNNRTLNGPPVGSPYYRYNTDRVMASAGDRPAGISSNDGYDNVATYGNAKNILTIGAVSPLGNGPYLPENIQIAPFSSWGPTDDGRIKPDLVADGVRVISTSNAGNNSYTSLSGTSMATPNVSGSLILLQELYSQRNQNSYMRAATLKALAIGTAAEAGPSPGPDYSYGWGLLNMEAAAQAILDQGVKSKIAENVISQGEQQFIDLTASGNGPLTGTICWTDPEATPVSSLDALNNTTPRLINDLDLVATQGNNIYQPWVLDPAHPSAAATRGDNTRDNVEQVVISDPVPGATYRFKVSHKGVLRRGPQSYAIVLTGTSGDAEFQTVKTEGQEFNLNLVLYPVPAKDEINVSFNVSQAAAITVRLINIMGQELYRETKNNFSGGYDSKIPLASYSSGVYIIVVKVGDKSYTKKFVCVK